MTTVKPQEDVRNTERTEEDDKIRVLPNGGDWTMSSTLAASADQDVYIVKGDVEPGTPAAPAGKVFLGWDYEMTDMPTFNAIYEDDVIGGMKDDGTGSGDGIPDRCQRLVTFVVKNGTWDGNDAADIIVVVTGYEVRRKKEQ